MASRRVYVAVEARLPFLSVAYWKYGRNHLLLCRSLAAHLAVALAAEAFASPCNSELIQRRLLALSHCFDWLARLTLDGTSEGRIAQGS